MTNTSPRHFEAPDVGSRVTLGPDWLFSADDHPAYASPGYDDTGWSEISADVPLASYGFRNLRYAWYRIHVQVRPRARDLVIEMQDIDGGCEIFANGMRVGDLATMDSIQQEQSSLTFYDIPDSRIGLNGDVVIAIRFALNKTGRRGIETSTPLHGDSILLSSRDAAQRDASYVSAHQTAIPLILSGLGFVVGLVSLALYLVMRSRMEYMAIAVSLLANSFQLAEIVWYRVDGFNVQSGLWETLWLGIANVALIEFVRLILHLRWSRWLMALEIAVFLGYFGPNLAELGLLSVNVTMAVYFLPGLVIQAVLPVLLIRGLIRGNRDARVVLPAIAVVSAIAYWNFLSIGSDIWHWPFRIPPLPVAHFGSYEMDLWNMWNAIYFITMLLFVVLRTIGIARERARAAAELEAARVVQHVLIPEEIPAVPGFAFQSVYKPAGEVGGDFFQIAPIESGGALVIIGDVSGKGMPAAMTVSLLVGTFPTLAHYTQSPAEILTAMNVRMLARSHGGFTTCLVLRADPDGLLTLASAGHLAPYLAGKELALENGLPLGLAAGSTYLESTFHLAPGEQLTLLTDGVVEAHGKTGALFGFERTAAISSQSAGQIAETAELFGQDDDITVLTLMRERVEPLTANPLPVPSFAL
jgi:sigma-B regulation protein RsbU (phosphoserine phosphatase)